MRFQDVILVCVAASLAVASGCSAEPGTDVTETATPPHTSETTSQPTAEDTFTGRVAETMDAGTYTYVRVENDGEEIWAAAGRFEVAVGDRVVVPLGMPMENFHSDSLDRDFPVVYFAQVIPKEGEMVAAGMPAGHPPVTGASASHGTMELPSVEPAEGGVTVAAIWSDTSALAGTTVTVRGQVVKFNGGIMGTNWIHLQDGTGDSESGTHDITVTSSSTAKVGDVVTATGTVAVDKDFGAGYLYPVIIQDATITAN